MHKHEKHTTMTERNSFEILLDYPRQHELTYETHENHKRFYLFPEDPILYTKYIIFKKDSLMFCAFDTFATKAFMTRTFTGLYGLIDLPERFEYKIYVKDWLDRFLRFNKTKTGLDYIDKYLTITSKTEWLNCLLSQESVSIYRKIQTKIYPIELLIQNNYLETITELKGKKVIGLETNQWIYKQDDIDLFIDSGSQLIIKIINNCKQWNQMK